MTTMSQHYSLGEMPLEKPCLLFSALRDLDQGPFLQLMGRNSPFSRKQLEAVVRHAATLDYVTTVDANVPQKGVLTFVDLASLQNEFDSFVNAIEQSSNSGLMLQVRTLLTRKPQSSTTFRRRLLQLTESQPLIKSTVTLATPLILRVAERFCRTPEDYARLAASQIFRPSQFPEEICGLLHKMQAQQPKSVLEIGTNRGGTFYLFCRHAHATAKLATIDMQVQNRRIIESFGRHQQQIRLLEGNSTSAQMIQRIRDEFPNGLDFVLIDGDHSYEGVKTDYENYRPLVNSGGLIAFHDIVEDNETRYGIVTGGWAGGVPLFWKEIKDDFEHEEFIRDPAQDGLGIGVIRVP